LLKSGTREQVPPGFSWDGETQRWDISGVCQGLSFLYAIDPSNGKEAFFKKLKAISLWDGSLESLALPVQGEEEFGNLGELMDQWINEVLWFQCDTDEGPEGLMAMSQQHMKERFDVVARREQHLVQEGPLRLDGVSTQGLLEVLEVLRFQVGKSVILIAEHTFGSLHAVVLTPLQGGGWSYYDSNMQHQLRDSLSTENVRDLLLAYFLPSEGRENIDLLVSILTYGNGPDRNIEQPDMPEKSACGWTALHVAQLIGSPKATEDLLQSADFSTDHLLARDAFGNTPLLLAIAMGAADKIRLQLSSVPKEICRQLLAQRNSRGITPLSLAAIWSDVACVEALLDCCAPEHRYEILCATNAFRNFGVQHCLVERSPDMAVSLYDTLTKYMNVEERKAWIQQEFEPGCTARTRARNNPALLER
ncbi:MAG: ankyrin repeat domain-containing protein, partial [Chlamydiia bacterium]|nr:ankyrin repeat domain-containing protein [Chlamydiia bacterium]